MSKRFSLWGNFWRIFEPNSSLKNNLLDYVIRASKDVVSSVSLVLLVFLPRGSFLRPRRDAFCARSRDAKDERKQQGFEFDFLSLSRGNESSFSLSFLDVLLYNTNTTNGVVI